MKVGVSLPQAGQQATRENVIQMAKNAESEGFDSLWVFERLLWPINPQTPYPATPDGSLPIEFQIMLDPLETLTYVAANTNKIALGTSVIDMLFHNPVVLARRLATLDVLSGGRSIAGFGIGWSKDEYQASNIPFQNRGKRADEFIQVLKRIWTDDVVEFKGEYYNILASKIGPKPLQKPHLPIYLGGFSPNTFSRIVNYDTNGWMAVVGGPLEYIEGTIKSIKDIANKSNKDPNKFKVILLTYLKVALDSSRSTTTNEGQRFPFTGTVDQIGNDIKRVKQMDIDHIVLGYNFIPMGKDVDKMIDITKQLAEFAR
ncbi:MAG TPA: TIGR03619 family F420-dependent LLM class oxidoreductase [Nitrososphaeraceae archaeon]|nr:TIGR03619 family F420-dependent LLM class oxidoreductase [Nitrososphaeraceae archaeon]